MSFDESVFRAFPPQAFGKSILVLGGHDANTHAARWASGLFWGGVVGKKAVFFVVFASGFNMGFVVKTIGFI